MKKLIPFLILLIFTSSCEWFVEVEPYAIEYFSTIEMDTRPFAMAVDDKSGELFVLCYGDTFFEDYSLKKYSTVGEFQEKLIDFESFNEGEFSVYSPVDLFIEGKRIYVIARPETETDQKVFSVLQFNLNGEFQDEFPFHINDGDGVWGAYYHLKGIVYKAGLGMVKTYPLNGKEGREYRFINEENVEENPFVLPVSDVAVNSEGKIYLTGQMPYGLDTVFWGISHHLTVYNPDTGDRLTTEVISDNLCIPGSMISQPQVEIGKQNKVYLTTFYCQELRVYEKSGKPLVELFLPDYSDERIFPHDLAVGNNRVYIADASAKEVLIFEEK
ncbi:MAG: hypothetical protein JW798_16665 [Prolixibacteraceae bacterium]|nr:hypothetical protein [Prolixibacteraceae bacterium]